MEQEVEDDVVDWGSGMIAQDVRKDTAKKIYKQLIEDDELMYEVNVLLRKHKLENLKK